MEIRMKTLIQAENEMHVAAQKVMNESNFYKKGQLVDALIAKQVAAFQVLFREARDAVPQGGN